MNQIKQFFISAVVGGLLVILPVALFLFTMIWLFGLIRNTINPLTEILLKQTTLHMIVADIIVIILLFILCFVVGMIVRTRLG